MMKGWVSNGKGIAEERWEIWERVIVMTTVSRREWTGGEELTRGVRLGPCRVAGNALTRPVDRAYSASTRLNSALRRDPSSPHRRPVMSFISCRFGVPLELTGVEIS